MNCFQGKERNILPDNKGKAVIFMIILVCLSFPLWAQSGSFTMSTLESTFPSIASLKNRDSLQRISWSPWTERHNSMRLVRDECYDQLYNRSMGWFCKTEWKLEQKTGIPFRFRLGSYDSAARLEGKL